MIELLSLAGAICFAVATLIMTVRWFLVWKGLVIRKPASFDRSPGTPGEIEARKGPPKDPTTVRNQLYALMVLMAVTLLTAIPEGTDGVVKWVIGWCTLLFLPALVSAIFRLFMEDDIWAHRAGRFIHYGTLCLVIPLTDLM